MPTSACSAARRPIACGSLAVVLRLDHHWIWDVWFATREDEIHVFFLHAPRSLGDPDLRHVNARVGHAVSHDLRRWEVLPEALAPGGAGTWDDLATWTGSVVAHDDHWHMFHTGVARAEDGAVQRIGVATSEDLLVWHKHPDPLVEADARWYAADLDGPHDDVAWRDPWVHRDPATGDWRMLVTARATHGPVDGRGVLGAARSRDLWDWEVLPPVTEPGDLDHLEVPQLLRGDDRWFVLFSAEGEANGQRLLDRTGTGRLTGTAHLVGDAPTGPFHRADDEWLVASPRGELYAGRIVEHAGAWWFLAFVHRPREGPFVGALSDPIRVHLTDGSPVLDRHDLAAAVAAGSPGT